MFDGAGETDNLLELTDAAANLGTLTLEGCEVRNTAKHILYNNKKGTFGTIAINNTLIDGIANNAGDGFDLRGGALTALTVTNSTLSNGIRSLVRCQVPAAVTFRNCTCYNLCTIDDGNNTGLFRVEKDGSTLTVENCLFYGIGLANPNNANSGVWARADKLKAAETYANNYYFNCPNLIVIYYGDNIATEPTDEWNKDNWRIRLQMAKLWAEAINRHGGDAEVVYLPDLNIRGNTHFMFADLNNKDIANLMEAWLKEKSLDK